VGRTPRRRPTPAALIALLALFIALDGPAEARRLLRGSDLRKGAITAREVRNGALTGGQVKNRSLHLEDLARSTVATLRATPPASIGAKELQAGAVGTAALADGGVASGKLAAGAVGPAALAPGAVGTAVVADASLTAADLAAGAVGNPQLADGSVDGPKIADGRLRLPDVASFTGTFTWDPPALAAGTCAETAQPVAQIARGGAQDLRDDVIALTPPAGWPGALTLTVRATGPQQLTVAACAVATADAPAATFRYASFDG
jgi:hypothetical protein